MEKKLFWNEVAKYGLLLGVAMGGSKILEQSLGISGNLGYAFWIFIEWLLFAVLFFAVLYRATKKRADSLDPVLGFSFAQSVNYMVLISVFAAIPVACIYYVYLDLIIGYENYVEGAIAMVVAAAELQPLEATTASAVELVIEQLRSQAQPSIFSVLFSTIMQYAFAGLFAGITMSAFIARRPQIFNQTNENE